MSHRIARRNRIVPSALVIALGLLVAAAPAAEVTVRRTRVKPAAGGYRFGTAIALDGRTLVSGASGEVFVLQRSLTHPDRWSEVARLAPDGPGFFDNFGAAVAVSGDTLVAGTQSLGAYPGAWIFQRNDAGGWTEVLELMPEGGRFLDPGGVAIDGDIAAVGDQGDDFQTGAVYLFSRHEGGTNHWGQVAKLVPAEAGPSSYFGASVALAGNTLVAGAVGDSALGALAGGAWVFQWAGAGSGLQVTQLSAADGAAFDRFGSSVDIDGDTIVVGARQKGLMDLAAGAAYVFDRNRGGAGRWGGVARLVPTNFANNDEFGASVAVRGDQILVGAYGDDDLCPSQDPEYNCDAGAAYLFSRNRGGPGRWGLVEKTHAPQGALIQSEEQFGHSVDLDATRAVIGGPGRNNAYVYRRLGLVGAEKP